MSSCILVFSLKGEKVLFNKEGIYEKLTICMNGFFKINDKGTIYDMKETSILCENTSLWFHAFILLEVFVSAATRKAKVKSKGMLAPIVRIVLSFP